MKLVWKHPQEGQIQYSANHDPLGRIGPQWGIGDKYLHRNIWRKIYTIFLKTNCLEKLSLWRTQPLRVFKFVEIEIFMSRVVQHLGSFFFLTKDNYLPKLICHNVGLTYTKPEMSYCMVIHVCKHFYTLLIALKIFRLWIMDDVWAPEGIQSLMQVDVS